MSIQKDNLRIIFLGTPEFAVESLKRIIEQGFHVVAVITAPDKPAGRGKKIRMSAVKEFALEKQLPILQPSNLKNKDFLDELRNYRADIQVVIAFRMLPEVVWSMPARGTFNLHASLLPDYRGAAPINHVIINGETQTGVTTFFLKHEIDTGDILFQEKIPVEPNETAGELHDKLMELGAKAVLHSLNGIIEGNLTSIPQDQSKALNPAPKIFPKDCEIDWNKDSVTVHNHIRGLSPFPGAYTTWQGKKFKIFKASISDSSSGNPGSFETDWKSYLRFSCSKGAINLLEVQLEGKRRMDVRSFLSGQQP